MTTLPAAALTRQTTKESYKIFAKPVSKSVLSHFLFEKIYFSKINSWNWKLFFTFLYFYEFIEKHLKWSTQWIFENEHLLISKFWKKNCRRFCFSAFPHFSPTPTFESITAAINLKKWNRTGSDFFSGTELCTEKPERSGFEIGREINVSAVRNKKASFSVQLVSVETSELSSRQKFFNIFFFTDFEKFEISIPEKKVLQQIGNRWREASPKLII